MSSTQMPSPGRIIPPHVPPELVYYAGITESDEFLAAPHRFMAELHQKAPPICDSMRGLLE